MDLPLTYHDFLDETPLSLIDFWCNVVMVQGKGEQHSTCLDIEFRDENTMDCDGFLCMAIEV